jgi:lipopolysaccharide/colanic/teichoic acid biosynthesis glycosyltransferase
MPGSSPAGRCGPVGRQDWYTATKAVADYLAAALLLVLTCPVMLVAGLLTRATSRGPAIYRQIRLGRSGRAFTIYKLRSMHADCERATGPKWATPDDPRLTPLGGFLRRTHIDELPQLFNVLRGEMGLIGPRPERPEFVSKLEKTIPFYRDRERILPGVTGLAQVQLPPDTDVSEVHHKLACDLYYLRNQGPWLDLRILLGTATKVVGIPTRVSCRLLGIPSGAVVEEAYCRLASSADGREPRAAGPEDPGTPSGWDREVDAERTPAWGGSGWTDGAGPEPSSNWLPSCP